jgi:D-beta-D-heptose 7-phosphate kinase / D-beta-D-heptose 1-phosphate adenosyltransferase
MLKTAPKSMQQFAQPDETEILQLLRHFIGRRIVVIGDAMLDHYIMGSVNRISPEAPVPVIEFTEEHHTLGGAGNVAKAAAALGAQVELIAVIGSDLFGEKLKFIAKDLGIQVESLLLDHTRPTTSKTRIVAGTQHIVRVDREYGGPVSEILQHRITVEIERCAKSADAFILSDYAKGVLSHSVCRAAITAAAGKPIIVDPKGSDWERYRHATVIKPNTKEAQAFSGRVILNPEDAARIAQDIGQDLQIDHVIVTLGEQGAVLVADAPRRDHGNTVHLPSRNREVFDITGAGDVVAATLTVALAGGGTIGQAAWLANAAAGVCVGRLGASAVSQQDIISALDDRPVRSANKVIHPHEAVRLAARLRAQGKKLVFTNGCFDLLHVGHVALLEQSRRAGDALFVGLNTDSSVKRIKGPSRPIQSELDRAQIVAAQGSVDAVVLFDDDTPYQLIQALQPDIITKGADYSLKEDVIGWDVVEARGGHVLLLDLVEGRSSTGLINRAGMIGFSK